MINLDSILSKLVHTQQIEADDSGIKQTCRKIGLDFIISWLEKAVQPLVGMASWRGLHTIYVGLPNVNLVE